ncbi:MAG TPA: hypothetical protein VE915_04370 [Actinomycetota bacterium]|nr:hypothetical protein [Actinomycetota bacterium]
MAQTGSPARQRGLVLSLTTFAVAAAVIAAVLVVLNERFVGFLAALGAGSALFLAGAKAAEAADARLRFSDSLAERLVDAVILGTVAWVAFPERAAVAAAALAALVVSYLASYLRARAVGLGFRVEETLLTRPARMTFVALGVLDAPALGALWIATAISLQAVIVRAVAVARQKESR